MSGLARTHSLIVQALVHQAEARIEGAHAQLLEFDAYLMQEEFDRPEALTRYLREHQAIGAGRFANRHNAVRDWWIAGLMHELVSEKGYSLDSAAREAIKSAKDRALSCYQEMRDQHECDEEEAARAAVRTLGDETRRRFMAKVKRGEPPEQALHDVIRGWHMAKKSARAAYARITGD